MGYKRDPADVVRRGVSGIAAVAKEHGHSERLLRCQGNSKDIVAIGGICIES